MPITSKTRHEATRTAVQIGADEQKNGLRIDQILVQTPNVIVDRTHFDGTYEGTDRPMIFDSEDIHVNRTGDDEKVSAEVRNHDVLGPYLVVKLADYTNLYLPMNVCEKITEAMNEYKVQVTA